MPQQEIAIEVASEQIQQLNQSLSQWGASPPAEPGRACRSHWPVRIGSGRCAVWKSDAVWKDLNPLPIATTADGRKLTLGDIGQVSLRPKANDTEVYYQNQPAILLLLKRSETSDSPEIRRNHASLAEGKKTGTPPPSIQLIPADERYTFIEQRGELLFEEWAFRLVLVVAILFVFLNGRVAFWVAFGIPVSFMGTLAVLYFAGGSINMISLFALIMALGVIVDDAIVVAEDALTHYQTGESSLQAAEGEHGACLCPSCHRPDNHRGLPSPDADRG